MSSLQYSVLKLNEYINSPQTTICRLCLNKYRLDSLLDINDPFEETTIAGYVTDFTKINITNEDCFSNLVCRICLNRLQEMEDFKRHILDADQFLNVLYSIYDREREKAPNNKLDINNIILLSSESDNNENNRKSDNKIGVTVYHLNETIVSKAPSLELSRNDRENKENSSEDDINTQTGLECESVGVKQKMGHSPNLKHSCYYCGKLFKSYSGRYTHMQNHFVQNYTCEFCNRKFSQRYKYLHHKRTHLNPNKCEQCGKVFVKLFNLESHMEMHANTNKYQCDECGKCFVTKLQFAHHKTTHSNADKPDIKCKICNKIISGRSRSSLYLHMRTHQEYREKLCSQCGKTFKSLAAFHIHSRRHQNSFAVKCELCQKKFASQRTLKIHKDSMHCPEALHSCEICGKRFTHEGSWYAHGKVHTKDNPLICEICDKQFRYPSNLSGHMEKAHGN